MTKVISFFNQKGGVGKSDLTNIVANELILSAALENKKITVLVIDVDEQHSIVDRRNNDISLIKGEKGILGEEGRSISKRLILLQEKYPFISYYVHSVYDDKTERAALDKIKSGKFDFVFIDMPGTLSQEHTEALYNSIEYLIIPFSYALNDVSSTKKFIIDTINYPPKKLISAKCLVNKNNPQQFEKVNKMVEDLKQSGLDFYKNRISNHPKLFSTSNSILPVSVKVNLNSTSVEIQTNTFTDFLDEFINNLNIKKNE